VSSAGTDSNKGASSSSPVRTISRAQQLLGNGSNSEIIFQRGDHFALTSGLMIHGDNVLIGAYGTGDRPEIDTNGYNGFSMISSWGHDTAIQGLAFNDPNQSADAVSPHGINIVVRDCKFFKIGTAINCKTKPK